MLMLKIFGRLVRGHVKQIEKWRVLNSNVVKTFQEAILFFYPRERAGWIPNFGDLTYNLAAQYGWVYGLSVTEMEIVHGAFWKLNPNG